MGYVEGSLGIGERVAHRSSVTPMLLAAPLVIVFVTLPTIATIRGDVSGIFIALPILAIAIPAIVLRLTTILTTHVAVTTERFLLRTGIVRRRTDEIPLSALKDLEIEQGMFGQLFDYGTIRVRTEGTDVAPIAGIRDPHGLRKAVYDQVQLSG